MLTIEQIILYEHINIGGFIGGNRMLTGTVKWFSEDSGFGVVIQDDGYRYIFAHTSILTPGQKISYILAKGVVGMVASDIRTMN